MRHHILPPKGEMDVQWDVTPGCYLRLNPSTHLPIYFKSKRRFRDSCAPSWLFHSEHFVDSATQTFRDRQTKQRQAYTHSGNPYYPLWRILRALQWRKHSSFSSTKAKVGEEGLGGVQRQGSSSKVGTSSDESLPHFVESWSGAFWDSLWITFKKRCRRPCVNIELGLELVGLEPRWRPCSSSVLCTRTTAVARWRITIMTLPCGFV